MTHREILGRAVNTGITVGWYAVDERLADAVRRFANNGADPSKVWVNDKPRNVEDLLTALVYDLQARPETSIVVVDTLSKLLAGSGVNTNDGGEVERAMGALVDFFHAAKVGGVLIYHTGKSGRTYRGSTALGATVDDIATLMRRDTRSDEDGDDFDDDDAGDDGRRLLKLDGRYLRGTVQLVAEARSGRYQLYDGTASLRDRVLNALSRGPAKNRTELAKWTGNARTADVFAEIAHLIASGDIVPDAGGYLHRFPTPQKTSTGSEFRSELPEASDALPPYGNHGKLNGSLPTSVPPTLQKWEVTGPDEIVVDL